MRPIIAILAFLSAFLASGCGHNTTQLKKLRMQCLENGGVLHVRYGNYISSWEANSVECWYGIDKVQLETLKMLQKDPMP